MRNIHSFKAFIHLRMLLLLMVAFSCKETDETTSEGMFVNIPDNRFKTALLADTAINVDDNQEISIKEAAAFEGDIEVQNLGIADMTGLEAFSNVTRISCFGNELTQLDVSKNTKIIQLLCESNAITRLDISSNVSLIDFKAHSNELVELNASNSNNENFTRFEAQQNTNLNCIQVDTGFIPPNEWLKPANTAFSANCN